jgi:hypothetical protein
MSNFRDMSGKDWVEYGLYFLLIICCTTILYLWIKSPSHTFGASAMSEYNECIKIVLNHEGATIEDAERACERRVK